MGFFNTISNLFIREKRTANTEQYCPPSASSGASDSGLGSWFNNLFGVSNKAGVSVNRRTVLGIPAVWRAVNIISGSMASLNVQLYKETKDGSKRAKTHPISKLFAHEPHPYLSTYQFIRTLVQNACLGNGYAWIERNPTTMRPRRLHILDPQNVSPYMSVDGTLIYHVSHYGKSMVLMPDEIIHIQSPSFDGITGQNVTSIHSETLGNTIAATEYGSAFFGNGATPAGVVEVPGKMTNEQKMSLKSGWFEKYGGVSKVGEVAVLDNGMTFKRIGLNPMETALIEIRKFSVAEISRLFGVPPHLLHDLDRATFNSVEMLSVSFVQFTLLHWAKLIEGEFNRKLLFESEKEKGELFFHFNLDSLLRGDVNSRAQYYRTMFDVGAMSSNDIRRLENMNAREGGDEYFVSLALKGSDTLSAPKGENKTEKSEDVKGKATD
jgi:HK97 family phage portal protein